MASSTSDHRARARALARTILRAALAWVAALAVAPAAAPAAAAPDQTAKQAAEAKLVTGVRFLKRGEYEQALAKFEEAYALVASPLIEYDLGLAYLGLGRNAEAMEAFERFLGEAPDAPADKRSNAERYRDDVRGRVAAIQIDADVREAAVTVDGRARGRGPLPRRLYLDPGAHAVTVAAVAGEAGASGARTETVVAVAGGSSTLSLRLAGAPAAAPSPGPAAGAAVAHADAGRTAAPPSPPPAPLPPARQVGAAPPAPARPATGGATPLVISSAAVGAVALGSGLSFGLMARSQGEALSAASDRRDVFDPEIQSSGHRDQRIETILLAVGAVAVAAAVVLYVVGRPHARAAEGRP
jgi:hypothetical protein